MVDTTKLVLFLLWSQKVGFLVITVLKVFLLDESIKEVGALILSTKVGQEALSQEGDCHWKMEAPVIGLPWALFSAIWLSSVWFQSHPFILASLTIHCLSRIQNHCGHHFSDFCRSFSQYSILSLNTPLSISIPVLPLFLSTPCSCQDHFHLPTVGLGCLSPSAYPTTVHITSWC